MKQEEVEQARIHVENERIAKSQREEYILLGKLVNALPSVAQSKREIESLNEQLNMKQIELKTINQHIELRQKQFQLLLHAMNQLATQLQDENINANANANANAMDVD